MPNLNKVMLMGNLTRDPEIKYTPKGTAIAAFGLAVNRSYTLENGEKREEVTFVDCEAYPGLIFHWNLIGISCGACLCVRLCMCLSLRALKPQRGPNHASSDPSSTPPPGVNPHPRPSIFGPPQPSLWISREVMT